MYFKQFKSKLARCRCYWSVFCPLAWETGLDLIVSRLSGLIYLEYFSSRKVARLSVLKRYCAFTNRTSAIFHLLRLSFHMQAL